MPSRRRAVAAAAIVALLAACSPTSGDAPGASQAGDARATATATAGAGALAGIELRLEPVIELDAPTALAVRDGDDEALYIAERGGRIVRVVDGATTGDPVLDIGAETTTDGERGLLGFDFADGGGQVYVSSTDRDGNSRLDAYRMDGATADPASRRNLLQVTQPYANHNGGNVVTGPDGALYLGLGDGGAAGDPQGNGQDTSTLLGALLRLRPDEPSNVPDDNPFVGDGDARPEIWVYGLRNPWRFSFDRATDDLWIGDVGQGAIEEIDRLPSDEAAGANLGWSVFEGTQRYSDGEAPNAVPPVHEYPHDDRCSVTGGYVYRGTAMPELDGAYLYGDYCDGVVRALTVDGDRVTAQRAFDVRVPELVAFGEDANGELYALSLGGAVSRLVRSD